MVLRNCLKKLIVCGYRERASYTIEEDEKVFRTFFETKSGSDLLPALGGRVTAGELAFEQTVDFVTHRVEVVQPQVHDGIADVCHLVGLFQDLHNQIAHHAGGDFRLAHRL